MTFPSGVPDGYEYINPENNNVYRWDDPPGAWTFIGTNAGNDGGGNPNPPGEGLVEGTDLNIQCSLYQHNFTAQYNDEDIYIRADTTKITGGSDYANVFFSYSYDAFTWYPCNETGGAKTGLIPNITKVEKSNGDTYYVAKEMENNNRLWKSNDGIDWFVESATGLPSGTASNGYASIFFSRDTLLLFETKRSNNPAPLSDVYYASTDDGATWSRRTLPIAPVSKLCFFIDKDVILYCGGSQGSSGSPDIRVSINGGSNWSQTSGLPTGSTNWNQTRALFSCSKTDPKTYYVIDTAAVQQHIWYLSLSDLETGTRVWNSVGNSTQGSTNYRVQSSNGYLHSMEKDGITFLSLISASTGYTYCLVLKFNSNNDSLDGIYKLRLPKASIPSGSTKPYAPTPYWPSMIHPARYVVLSPEFEDGHAGDNLVFGAGRDLYYNGLKLEFSSINRPVLS